MSEPPLFPDKCPNCNADVPKGQSHCPNCGAAVYPRPHSGPMTKLAIVFLSIGAIACGLVGGCGLVVGVGSLVTGGDDLGIWAIALGFGALFSALAGLLIWQIVRLRRKRGS